MIGILVGIHNLIVAACLFELIGITGFVLSVIALFMIFTRRKFLGKEAKYARWGLGCFISLIGGEIILIVFLAVFILQKNPSYLSLYLLGSGLIMSILGPLFKLLPIFPLTSQSIQTKIKWCLVAVIVLSLGVIPIGNLGLQDIEDEFNEEFKGRSYSGSNPDNNTELMNDMINWTQVKLTEDEDILRISLFNAASLLPLAILSPELVRYAGNIRKRHMKKNRPPPNYHSHPYGKEEENETITKDAAPHDSLQTDNDIYLKEMKTRTCNYCGKDLIIELDFCPSCGAYLKD